jgi:hypothetical protein
MQLLLPCRINSVLKVLPSDTFGVAAEATDKVEESGARDDDYGGVTMTPSAMCYKAIKVNQLLGAASAEAIPVKLCCFVS